MGSPLPARRQLTSRSQEAALKAEQDAASKQESTPRVDAPLKEVNRLWALRDYDACGYDVELICLETRLTFTAGGAQEVGVLVRNAGTERLPWGGGPPNIRASYHWLTPAGDVVVADGDRTLMSAPIAPGGEGVVLVQVVAPGKPGDYILELDLVHEHVRWFERGTSVPARVIYRANSRSGCLRTNRAIPRQCQSVWRVSRRRSITAA